MSDLDQLWSALQLNVMSFLKDELKQSAEGVLQDVNSYLNDGKTELKQWTEDLAAGAMSLEDYESLLRGQGGLAKMVALKQLGLSKARMDEIKGGLADTILKTVSGFLHL
jgi:hypothetical protein